MKYTSAQANKLLKKLNGPPTLIWHGSRREKTFRGTEVRLLVRTQNMFCTKLRVTF